MHDLPTIRVLTCNNRLPTIILINARFPQVPLQTNTFPNLREYLLGRPSNEMRHPVLGGGIPRADHQPLRDLRRKSPTHVIYKAGAGTQPAAIQGELLYPYKSKGERGLDS